MLNDVQEIKSTRLGDELDLEGEGKKGNSWVAGSITGWLAPFAEILNAIF